MTYVLDINDMKNIIITVSLYRYNNLLNWCKQNCSGDFYIKIDEIFFENKSDCVLYKLLGGE
jgi:hypothetical protein